MGDNVRIAPVSVPTDLAVPELLDSLADGAYITDLDRKILCWNRAAERITGWSAIEVVGRSCFDNILVHVDKQGCALCGKDRCPLRRSIVTGEPSTEPLLIFAQRKTGSRVPVEVSVGPIRNHDGGVIGGVEVFRDLTEVMQDLLRAKGIQDNSVCSPLPEDARLEVEVSYHPRNIVGGDFYRIERLDADIYALMVADAMGHGVAGALCAMQLRSLWGDHQAELESPALFLSVINERLHGLVRGAGYLATAVCATYDAGCGQLRCARAGHPAPLLFRANEPVESVGQSQLALGMLPGITYTEASVQLTPGDALLFFTDGAVELFDATEHELGVAGLKRLVRQQIARDDCAGFRTPILEEQLLRYSNLIRLPDDLTLLKLRRTA